MTIPSGLWPLILFAVALFLLPVVAQGIRLERAPLALFEIGLLFMIVLLAIAVTHQGHEPLENLQTCTTPSTLAGCPGYNPGVIDPERNIPVSGIPMIRPTPLWAQSPGGPP